MVSALLAFGLLAGCGGADAASSSQSQPAPAGTSSGAAGKLVAGRIGFGVARSGAGSGLPDYVWAVTMVSNNTDLITGLTASFSVYDQAAAVIGQSSTSAPIMRAGSSMAVGTSIEVPAGSQISRVVATVSPLENLAQKDDHPESKFTAVGVHLQQGTGSGSSQVLGEIVGGYQQPVHQVYVSVVCSVVCFDAAGTIIGGGEHYVDAINPGQRVGFSTDGLIVSGTPARCEAFPSLSGASG
ncbi:hypothetical protein [Frankia sp. QA3]|uniref:hypothetical protein n=1 Tax=Frankia sp. QA3 TaxID=710111 RepID=UPI000269C08C|nr:hypothetical protein [Frankia sp. QA3]EIV92746.1 hypothetical protein FraQA3DRAFT_2363 [Frankia sp. QA3]